MSASKSERGAVGWIVVGALVAGVAATGTDRLSVFAALVGAALGYLLWKLRQQAARIEALERRLQSQAQAMPEAEAVVPATRLPETAPELPATAPMPQPMPQPQSSPQLDPQPEPPRRPPPDWAPPPPAPPGWFDRQLAHAWNWLRSGNPLAKIGIVVLFFGAAFLAKYAAERSVFPIGLRFAGLALGAAGLTVLGWKLRRSRAGFAQLLQGGGIAGLYLTVFAATRLYALLPPTLALGLLVMIALLSAVLALTQDAVVLAFFGSAGGFMAPVLVSSGSGNHVALFAYYTVLNLGIFAVAWRQSWRELSLLGFVFTFGITALWRASDYETADRASGIFFLLLFFALYLAMAVLSVWRQQPSLRGPVSGSLVFGLPIAAFGLLVSMLQGLPPPVMAWGAAGFASVYAVVAALLWRRERFGLLAEAFAGLAIVFATLAIPLAFGAHATSAMWAVEGAGVLWLGLRQPRGLARALGLLLQLAALVALAWEFDAATPSRAFLNDDYLGLVLIAGAGFFSAEMLRRHRQRLPRAEQSVHAWVLCWAWGGWLAGSIRELHQAPIVDVLGADLAMVSVSSLVLVLWAAPRAWSAAVVLASASLATAAVVGLCAIRAEHPSADGGAWGWPLLIGAAYAGFGWRERAGERRLHREHALAFCLIALLGAWELSWQLDRAVGGIWAWLPWGAVPALSLAAILLLPQGLWPLSSQGPAYRHIAAPPLAFAVAAWLLMVNLGPSGAPLIVRYVALLNPLDLSAAWGLAALALYRRALTGELARRASFALAALMLVWLSSALVRGLHHVLGTPWDWSGLLRSWLVQAALSLFWGAIGLAATAWAARRSSRTVWFAGAGLLGVVVLKLFLLDLAGRGSLPRIVSFIGVGGLMLLAGYLSPLPPKKAEKAVD